MRRNKRIYEDDDGCTIADMSDVSAPNAFLPRQNSPKAADTSDSRSPQRPWEQSGFSRKERLMVVLGVMKGTMLIALAYILGFGLLIGLLCLAIYLKGA